MSDKSPTQSQPSAEDSTADKSQNEPTEKKKTGFDEAAESEMMRRLRDLGYVE